jgi:hypothetical protein
MPFIASHLTLSLRSHGGVANMASAEVLMVFGVNRHAARNVLPKAANLTESDAAGGPALLTQGVQQAYSAGLAFQQRYLNKTTCASTCLLELFGILGECKLSFEYSPCNPSSPSCFPP